MWGGEGQNGQCPCFSPTNPRFDFRLQLNQIIWSYTHFTEIHFNQKWLRCTFPKIAGRAFLLLWDEPNFFRESLYYRKMSQCFEELSTLAFGKSDLHSGESEFQWFGSITKIFWCCQVSNWLAFRSKQHKLKNEDQTIYFWQVAQVTTT